MATPDSPGATHVTTLAEFLAHFYEGKPGRRVNVIVTTPDGYEALVKRFEIPRRVLRRSLNGLGSILGVPVHVESDPFLAFARAYAFAAEGRRPLLLVMEPPVPLPGTTMPVLPKPPGFFDPTEPAGVEDE